MSISPRETLLCRCSYDPLDRLIEWETGHQASIHCFYRKSRLATEIQGSAKYSFLQHDEQLLAQQRQMGDKVDTTLLATDQQRSVLNALDTTQLHPRTYSPYGHHPCGNILLSLLGFNGERPDPVTGHYHLGNGYRQFNPRLMRFNSPDSWSPFGKGGLNAYMYCGADPVNRSDPSGHSFVSLASRLNLAAPKKTAQTVGLGLVGALSLSSVVVAGIGGITNNKDMLIAGLVAFGTIITISTGVQASLISTRPARPLLTPRRHSQLFPPPPPSYNTAMELDTPPPSYNTAIGLDPPPPSHVSVMDTNGPPPSYGSVSSSSQTPTRQRAEQFTGALHNSLREYNSIRRKL